MEAEASCRKTTRSGAAHRALVDRILNGAGQATTGQRARAFGNDGLAPPLDVLIGKVATSPAQVTEADFAAAKAAGCTEDQLFELAVCAALDTTNRLADAFGFAVLSPEGFAVLSPGGFAAGAKYLLKRGYR